MLYGICQSFFVHSEGSFVPHHSMYTDKDVRAVNELRYLCASIVNKANSGHPGGAVGMSPMAYVLFTRFMRFNPADPFWQGRDRFILSNGHCSALQYALLHLCGFDYSIEDLQRFRQLNSKTPGHPERVDHHGNRCPGIEVSTGPLGQGIANGVGMTIARDALKEIDTEGLVSGSRIFVFTGDGCLQEGITSEACSLAGTRKTDNLIVLYDDNGIQIDGKTDLSFTEDVSARYKAYGWHVIEVANGDSDLQAIHDAIQKAIDHKGPVLIRVKTTIGLGLKNQGTSSVHGSPPDAESLQMLANKFGITEKPFEVSKQTYETFKAAVDEKVKYYNTWKEKASKASYASDLLSRDEQIANITLEQMIKILSEKVTSAVDGKATRNISQTCLQALVDSEMKKFLIIGSADLTPSCLTGVKNFPEAQYVHFGVREMAMGSICNGISSFGYFVPFDSTFLTFLTYFIGSVRVGCLSKNHAIHVLTHDSIHVGEDGPTHQPIEVVQMVRAMPNFYDWRPCDRNESVGAYAAAFAMHTSQHAMCMSRQNIPLVSGSCPLATGKYGGYVIHENENAEYTIITSGGEVHLCVEIAKELGLRVVSMPSMTLFKKQSCEYKNKIIKTSRCHTISVEPYVTFGWEGYAAHNIGINSYGLSGNPKDVAKEFKMDLAGLKEQIVAAMNSKSCQK